MSLGGQKGFQMEILDMVYVGAKAGEGDVVVEAPGKKSEAVVQIPPPMAPPPQPDLSTMLYEQTKRAMKDGAAEYVATLNGVKKENKWKTAGKYGGAAAAGALVTVFGIWIHKSMGGGSTTPSRGR